MADVIAQGMARPLPSLKQWLQSKGVKEMAPEFDAFAALSNLAERTILQRDSGLPVEQACFLRLWQGFTVASVELCNLEHSKGVPVEVVLTMLPRVMATAALYAFASVAPEDAAFRQIAKLFTEEFRAAAKTAADGLEERGSAA